MTSLLNRPKDTSGGKHHGIAPGTVPQNSAPTEPPTPDPNAPVRRLQLNQKCLYERMLPGNAFISAHANRLQRGYYESSALHETALDNVYFVQIHFVFHPYNHRSHRFKSATISVSINGSDPARGPRRSPPASSPRILKHAPELMYGAVSPENLQWNFSLSSSLGVSSAPVTATVNPYGGMISSYKVFDMMSIQGSLRMQQSPFGPEHDIEDGMAVWTLEENKLQRSGLPRDFDFVLLVHKPQGVKNVYLTVDVDAVVEGWFSEYPQWYTNLSKYLPTQDYTLDFRKEVGQKFLPVHPRRGFNFADLPYPLEQYVQMPGTTYPTNDTGKTSDPYERRPRTFDEINPGDEAIQPVPPGWRQQPTLPVDQPPTSDRPSWIPETVNVHVMLEHRDSLTPRPCHYGDSSIYRLNPARQNSIRRKRPHSGLKEYVAHQVLQGNEARLQRQSET